MHKLFLVMLAFGFFLAGCITEQVAPQQQSSQPAQQYLCPDGVNVVANLATCPAYDKDYQECMDLPSTSDYGSSAREECFYNLAIDRENISLCRKVGTDNGYYSEYDQGSCGATLAAAMGDPEVCEGLGVIGRYDCYSKLATQLEDTSMCDFINSTQKRDDCLDNYLSENSYYINDWSFCEKFSATSGNREYCYYEAAISTYETSYCDKLKQDTGYSYLSYSKTGCYAQIATGQQDPGVCSQLGTTPLRDACYYSYATNYPYDENTCNSITDSKKKSDCIRYTNDSYDYNYN